ncbi:hypothetical protein H6P81_002278 [Aristolochia fimbriata]|uniref:Uncharacterized protein n=1 Tax=Aristolochia fimbriata TaxID=158543 RepID=A0AAV7F9B3_ARIFI|nr:hypothetical protein H6P81_002278 [Aristolochia fimbriata]
MVAVLQLFSLQLSPEIEYNNGFPVFCLPSQVGLVHYSPFKRGKKLIGEVRSPVVFRTLNVRPSFSVNCCNHGGIGKWGSSPLTAAKKVRSQGKALPKSLFVPLSMERPKLAQILCFFVLFQDLLQSLPLHPLRISRLRLETFNRRQQLFFHLISPLSSPCYELRYSFQPRLFTYNGARRNDGHGFVAPLQMAPRGRYNFREVQYRHGAARTVGMQWVGGILFKKLSLAVITCVRVSDSRRGLPSLFLFNSKGRLRRTPARTSKW